MRLAERYASWYEDVETTIVMLLQSVDIEIDPCRTPEGHHAFHENVLKELQRPTNLYHKALGCGQVCESLWQAKNFRNMRRKGDIEKCRSVYQPYLDLFSTHRRIVRAGLLAAFRILATRNVPTGTDTTQQIRVQQQQLDKGRADLEREKKAFNESCAMKKEEVDKRLADQQKTLQDILAKNRATLEKKAYLGERLAQMNEVESSLQRALQEQRKLEAEVSDSRLAHSTCALGECKSAKDFESQVRIEHNRVLELQEELDIKTARLKRRQDREDTKTAELKRLQDRETARKNGYDISREELCDILYRHWRSQNPQELPIVTGKGTEDRSEDLAEMFKALLTSHAREVNKAKFAKDRQRKLQEENELLEQRLANAEAQNSTDRLVVETALSRMEDCVDSGTRILRSFFTKQETHRDSGSQKESTASR